MSNTCSRAAGAPVKRSATIAFALASMLAMSSLAHAASIGHSRLVSAPGEPLAINIPLRELSPADQQVLRVTPAPLAAWSQAALLPPVDLATMDIRIEPGFTADSRVILVRSRQPFNGPVADLLLQINTAAGSRQYQVSLLSQADPAGRIASPGGSSIASGASERRAGHGSSATTAIHVRRGDTMFALARAHGVEGVTVYQMMIALQKANPQAFIEGNINLVKAGATLAIPDAAALRAVSDREARRIFQQQLQAFAAYRDRIAARRGHAVQGGSAQQGTVSGPSPSVAKSAAVISGDHVVLSSARAANASAADAAQDQQDVTRRNIDESQGRVSQLERNVQSLSQALQMQGEAAKEAVLEGAAVVGQGLTDAASSLGLTESTPKESEAAGPDSESAQSLTSNTSAAAQAGLGQQSAPVSARQAAGEVNSGSAGADSQRSASTASPARDITAAGDAAGAAHGQTVNSNPTPGFSAPRAGSGAMSTAAEHDADTQPGTLTASSSRGTTAQPDGGVSAPTGPAGVTPGSDVTSPPTESAAQTGAAKIDSSKAEQPVSWFQENLLGIITGILAIVVLIIAWLLRRAGASRNEGGHGVVTEAMVQERLETIDLDLDSPAVDQRPTRSS